MMEVAQWALSPACSAPLGGSHPAPWDCVCVSRVQQVTDHFPVDYGALFCSLVSVFQLKGWVL